MSEQTSPMLERLQEFLKTRPKDSFVRYGYSMELSKLGRIDEAIASFRQLIEMIPAMSRPICRPARCLRAPDERKKQRRSF